MRWPNRSIVFTIETTRDPHGNTEFGMSRGNPALDAAFIDKQRQQLRRLKASLETAAGSSESEEDDVRADTADEALEAEDDAQKLAALELDGNLVVRDVARLEQVDRALEKIDEGTYGLSDLSGAPIPRERLEAVPEAIYTLAEEKGREKKPPARR